MTVGTNDDDRLTLTEIFDNSLSDLIDFQTHWLAGILESLAEYGEFLQLPPHLPDYDGVSISDSSRLTVSLLFLNSCSNAGNDENKHIADVIQGHAGSKEEILLNIRNFMDWMTRIWNLTYNINTIPEQKLME